MTLRKSDIDDVRDLLALQPSGDLTPEEARQVDEALRYSSQAQFEAARFADCLAVLRQSAESPTPTDDRSSLWNRIESQLGPRPRPASRFERTRRWLGSVPSSWLVAAMLLLASANLLVAYGGRNGNAPGPTLKPDSVAFNPRLPVIVDPRDERGFVRPLLGLVVCTCEGDQGGVVIDGVLKDTPAADAGLRPGDLVLSIEDCKIKGPLCIMGCLRRHGVGQKIELTIMRDGKKFPVEVMLGGLLQLDGRNLIIRESKQQIPYDELP